MNKLNFKLIKDNEIIIEENNINCIINENKTQFIIDGIKYTFENNIFTRSTKDELIIFDFEKELCKITLKEYNNSINLKLEEINIEKNNKIITIKYKIETEEEVNNIISIEYV